MAGHSPWYPAEASIRWTRFISRGDFGTNDRARLALALGASPSTDSDRRRRPAPPGT